MKFLSLEKEIFGMDISDRSLKVVSLKKKKKSFVLESFNQIEVAPGVIEDGVIKNEDALVKIIKSLLKSVKGKKIKTKYVVASLPEEKSFLQVIQMPKMEYEDLVSAVPFEAENYIPLPISEVYLDFQPIVPIKDHLDHLDVLIVATPKKIVNSYVSCLKKSGLIPVVLEVESEAIARALIKNETTQRPIILIDFGKTSTAFIIFAGRSIQFTCSIPISSEQLTQAISKSLAISIEKAERVKIKCDVSRPTENIRSKKILEATNPILEDLITQIKKYINFYQDHASHEHLSASYKIENILLCGGGANLKGLPRFFSEKLEIPTKLGDSWANFSTSKTPTNLKDLISWKERIHNDVNKDSLSFTTALGLALRSIKDLPN